MNWQSKTAFAAVLAALVATMAMASAASAAPLTDTIKGSGSTLVNPVLTIWNNNTGNKVTYGGGGSGKGITDVGSGVVDFGASDAPMTADQQAKCAGCKTIPVTVNAIGVAFNIPGVTKLKLTPELIAAIFRGQITSWDDGKLKAINKGVALPALKITPVHRSDGSGSTYAFTDFLSRSVKSWRSSIGVGTQVSWPGGAAGSGNSGVASQMKNSGTIGYVGVDYMIPNNLRAAAVRNAAGKYVLPNYKAIREAANSVTRVPKNNVLHIVAPKKKYKGAYPIATHVYFIVPGNGAKKAVVKQFVNYAITGGQRYGANLGFVPMSKPVVAAAKKTVKGL